MDESIADWIEWDAVPSDLDSIALEPSSGLVPVEDRRRRVPEPPPVRVVAVEDVRLPAQTGLERELDAFYVGIFGFERDADTPEQLIYHAENVAIRFRLVEGLIERESVRPTGIEVQSLSTVENILIEREIEYIRQVTLTPGQRSLLVPDPAGNWVEVFEVRLI